MSRKKTNVPQKGPSSEHRINQQIRAPKVRVVTEGKGIEEVETKTAIRMAEEAGLDLVEVSPNQDPPVCKIIDYGKYRYEQQKKKKEQAKNQHVIHIKEIKLKPKIGDHDYEIKVKHGTEFLDKGDKVKFSLRFRGREMAHPELGMKIMERVVKDVDEVGVLESPAKMEGRQIVMVIAPKPKKKVSTKSPDKHGEKDIEESDASPESETE